jgi:hypothetical protein
VRSRHTLTVAALVLAACATRELPPLAPPADLLGCYELRGDLPASYADSLGYRLPDVFRLDYWDSGQWIVLPTDFERHPNWVRYDNLPSGYVARAQRGPPHVIPGDSVDIYFPGDVGALVLRLGRNARGLGGRTEWVRLGPSNEIGPMLRIEAPRTSCEGLPRVLERVR